MSYESWRIYYQSSEQAARAAYAKVEELAARLAELEGQEPVAWIYDWQAPEGYLAWHEWAEIQHKAGLRQKECGRCGLWKYPQELSDLVDRHEAQSRKGPVTIETAVCNNCAKADQP